MAREELLDVPATTLAAWIQEGRVGLEEVRDAVLARIEARDAEIRAFAFFDPDLVRRRYDELELERRLGRAKGPLFGLPVGVKDIIDTADMPTEFGSPIHAGRRPLRDATVVARLRQAGAVVVGKTVTTEFAVLTPAETRNPHDPERSPGGSSSGSAAAVAAGMVPLALGSQTNGSVIRPASFCGVYGFKPSFGKIPRSGMLIQSPTLDHVGTFARSLEELALVSEVLYGFDPADETTRIEGPPGLLAEVRREPPMPPRFAFIPGPGWARAERCVREGFQELAEALGEQLVAIELPESDEALVAAHRRIWLAELAFALRREWERARAKLSPGLAAMIEEGRRLTAFTYREAQYLRRRLQRMLEEIFRDFDAILTPAALGEAPGRETTGDPICCTLWTLAGAPAVTLPLLEGEHGLPVGVQLVGAVGDDARLLRTARWLERTLTAEAAGEEEKS